MLELPSSDIPSSSSPDANYSRATVSRDCESCSTDDGAHGRIADASLYGLGLLQLRVRVGCDSSWIVVRQVEEVQKIVPGDIFLGEGHDASGHQAVEAS
jgi:hypothetical protein